MKRFAFDQKVLCSIVVFLLLLLIGGTGLLIERGRTPLEASESIVELVATNEVKLEAASKAAAACYSEDTFIELINERSDNMEGVYAVGADDDATHELVTDKDIIFAANLQNFNSIKVLSSSVVVFRKRIDVSLRGGPTIEEGFFYAKDADYNGIREYYESTKLFAPFESYEEGYVSQGKKKSFLYVEPIIGDFFYYYLFD